MSEFQYSADYRVMDDAMIVFCELDKHSNHQKAMKAFKRLMPMLKRYAAHWEQELYLEAHGLAQQPIEQQKGQ